MTYIDMINAFWNWRKFNVIPHSTADLFYCILDFANSTRWQDKITIPNSRIMGKIDISEKSLFTSRSLLIEFGLINYESGKKGQAGTYQINLTTLQSFSNKFSNEDSNDGNNSGAIRETITEQQGGHNKDIDKEIEIEKEKEKEKDEDEDNNKLSSVIVCYENNISSITNVIRDSIADWLKSVDSDVIIWAINEAVKLNKRNWKYIEGIIRNQLNSGNTTLEKIIASEKQRENNTKSDSYTSNNTYDFDGIEKQMWANYKKENTKHDAYADLFKKFELG